MSPRTRLLLIGITFLFLLFAAIRAAMPTALVAGFSHWLERQGAQQIQVGSVALDVTGGTLDIVDLRFEAGGIETQLDHVQAALEWRDTNTQQIRLSRLLVEGLRTTIAIDADRKLQVAGLAPPASPNPDNPTPALTIDTASLSGLEFQVAQSGRIDKLHVKSLKASLGVAEDRVVSAFSGGVEWNGIAASASGAWTQVAGKQSAQLDIDVPEVALSRIADELAATAEEKFVMRGTGRLEALISFKASTARDGVDGLQMRAACRIEVRNVELDTQEARARSDTLRWQGDIHLHGHGLVLDGELDGVGSQALLAESENTGTVTSKSAPMKIATSRLTWRGSLRKPPQNDHWSASGNALLEGLEVRRNDTADSLLAVGKANASDVVFTDRTLAIATVALSDLSLLGYSTSRTGLRSATSGRFSSVEGRSIRATPGMLHIGRLALGGLEARLVRDRQGNWITKEISDANGSPPPSAATARSDALRVRIGQLSMIDEGRVAFEDQAVTPIHRRQVDIAKLIIDDLDTKDGITAKIAVAAEIDRHAKLDAQANLTIEGGKPRGEMRASLRGLELAPLSPYAVASLNQQIVSGQLDLENNATVQGGKLEANNALTLRQLELKVAKEGAPDRLALGMPLDSALSLLRDRKGIIRLQLPIRGTLDDPKFEIRDAIQVATRNAMKMAAVTYIKQAIQPFGTFITLAELGAAGLDALVRLEPMRFEPTSTAFDRRGLDYLERIAALLADRPQMQLRICGKASNGEFSGNPRFAEQSVEERSARLTLLAQERAEAVKRALSTAHGISPERLALCQPQTGEDESLAARVDFLI